MPLLDYTLLFRAYDAIQTEKSRQRAAREAPRNALQAFLHTASQAKTGSGFQRMQKCRCDLIILYWFCKFVLCCMKCHTVSGREALEALDRQGWQRSFHQRLFHDNFIRACARIFWKTEPPGAFARDHQKILEMNGWDHLSQEILVSTPRR
jgi:predicted RNA binding protein YcfA (HicA-like mRNA interferase family)